MNNLRSKWNRKHKDKMEQLKEQTANPRLKKLSVYLNGGTALDLACGLGANSLFLASRDYQVQAKDISDVAIQHIQVQAEKYNLNVNSEVCDLTDLSKLHGNNSPFDLVVMTYYLDRSLFPIHNKLVKENGYFFMETYYQTPQRENQKVSKHFQLQPNELLTVFKDWSVLFFEENEQEGRQTIFCQKRQNVSTSRGCESDGK
jgi:tellurite methyltransferase